MYFVCYTGNSPLLTFLRHRSCSTYSWGGLFLLCGTLRLSKIYCCVLEFFYLRVVFHFPPFIISFNFCVGPPLSNSEKYLMWLLGRTVLVGGVTRGWYENLGCDNRLRSPFHYHHNSSTLFPSANTSVFTCLIFFSPQTRIFWLWDGQH